MNKQIINPCAFCEFVKNQYAQGNQLEWYEEIMYEQHLRNDHGLIP